MKIRTLLIDGSYLLQRSYHGAKDIYTSNFGHFGAVYQFLTTTRKLIKNHMITKVIICWDGEMGGIMRHQIDTNYKSNRKSKNWYEKIEMSDVEIRREREKEESILKQRKRVQAYVEELFLRQIEVVEVEADDLIAAYCLQHNNLESIHLYSNDRDFAQLLDLNITIIFPNIDQPVTRSNYLMHFNHHYSNALVLKIICGDDADNIKGIEGIGEKTLLEHFPELKFKHISVREICRRADEINKERIANKKKPLKALEKLISPEGVERLKTNFQLVNLREPMLNEQAIEELKQLEIPLSPEGRGSTNLLKMMNEDQFLSVYGSTFVQYVEPFYTVIMNEKQLFTEYIKNNRGNL
jgi:5'-3' exonuclease